MLDPANQALRFVAIRRGAGFVRNCIFLNWADCSSFLSSDLPGEVEFSIFENIEDAIAYITSSTANVHDHPYVGTPPATNDLDGENSTRESVAGVPLTATDSASHSSAPSSVNQMENSPAKKRKRSIKDSIGGSDKKPSKTWETMFARLKTYKDQHGDLNVPADDDRFKDLHRWIANQRKAYRALKSSGTIVDDFADEKIRRLLDLGFDFMYVSWECRFRQLEAFQSAHDVRSSNFEDLLLEFDRDLHRWWKQQQSHYKTHCSGRPSKLTSSQVHQLQRLGFSEITPKMDDEFEEMFQELILHKKAHGHCNVSTLDKANARLARWVNKQRVQYRKLKDGKSSQLTAQRMARLTEIGFVFCPKGKCPSWEERLAMLREKFDRDRHLRYPKSEQAMRSWIIRIRKEYQAYQEGQQSLLTQEKIDQLNELGMVWVTGFASGTTQAPRKTWNERFEDLKDFIRQHGHSVVPQATPGLGEWVHTQRVEYKLMQKGKKSVLTAERALQLVEIGFCFDAMQLRGKAAEQVDYRQPL